MRLVICLQSPAFFSFPKPKHNYFLVILNHDRGSKLENWRFIIFYKICKSLGIFATKIHFNLHKKIKISRRKVWDYPYIFLVMKTQWCLDQKNDVVFWWRIDNWEAAWCSQKEVFQPPKMTVSNPVVHQD